MKKWRILLKLVYIAKGLNYKVSLLQGNPLNGEAGHYTDSYTGAKQGGYIKLYAVPYDIDAYIIVGCHEIGHIFERYHFNYLYNPIRVNKDTLKSELKASAFGLRLLKKLRYRAIKRAHRYLRQAYNGYLIAYKREIKIGAGRPLKALGGVL